MTEPRTALITGASSGIGRALALWFARRGTRVFAAARREDALSALAAEAQAAGGTIEPVKLDVADTAEVFRIVTQLEKDSGGLELVVANAGVGGDTYAKRMNWELVSKIIQINVSGASATLCAALPGMVGRDKGHLVGISSVASLRGLPRSAAYSASKAFLTTFLEGLRVDLVKTRIQVTAIQPGFVKSELTAKNRFKMPFLLETEDAVDRIGRAILKGSSEMTFPWTTATLMRTLAMLPNSLYDRAAQRLR
ncbi:MAG: SDR family NAD(P)-dependent oxidoreductase [Myxococcaceae bacterium]